MKTDVPTVFKDASQIGITLPTDKPRGDEKGEWVFSSITAFKKADLVVQIAIETDNCNLSEEKVDKAAMIARTRELVAKVSEALFDKPFDLPGSSFSKLNANWKKDVSVKVPSSIPGVKAMKLWRGFSKCDGRSGFRFRYDFYL